MRDYCNVKDSRSEYLFYTSADVKISLITNNVQLCCAEKAENGVKPYSLCPAA